MARLGLKRCVECDLANSDRWVPRWCARDPGEGRSHRPAPTPAGAYRHCIRCGSAPGYRVAPLVHVETGGLGNPHRRHAGAQPKLSLLSRGQLGRIGKRDQKIGATTPPRGHLFPCSATTRPMYPRFPPLCASNQGMHPSDLARETVLDIFSLLARERQLSTGPGKLALVRESADRGHDPRPSRAYLPANDIRPLLALTSSSVRRQIIRLLKVDRLFSS